MKPATLPMLFVAGLLALVPFRFPAAQTDAGEADDRTGTRGDEQPALADRLELPRLYVEGTEAERQYGVTGTKTGTPLIETPQSVSVITDEQMQQQGVDNLAQALRYTAGADGEPFGFEPRTTFIRLRGFDATTTGLYRDGLQLRNPRFAVGYNIELYGAERIDILRGPASVLYGQGNPGGLVNYVTKRPKPVGFGEAELEVGSFDRVQGQFDFGGPAGRDGALSYRLTGLLRESDTQVDFVGNDRTFIAPALTWQPTASTSITFLSYYQDDETRASQAYPAEGTLRPNPHGDVPTDRFTGEPDVDRYDRTEYSLGYLLEHHAGNDWTLRQNLRFYASELDDVTVFTQGLSEDQRTLQRSVFGSFGDLEGFAVDNQAQTEFDTGAAHHTLLIGLDYQDVDVGSRQTFAGAPPLDVFDPVYGTPVPDPPVFSNTDTGQEQLGLYVQDQIEFTDRWVLSLNGRHDRAETVTVNQTAGTTSEQEDEAFTGRAGLVYLADNGFAPYVSYSESFLPSLGTDPEGVPFDPETGRQIETGVKYQPPGGNGFVTLALFELTREDVVETDPATFLPVQTGEVRSRGIELEAVASFDNGLDLTASYSYLDMEITESVDPQEVGERPTQVPDQQASIWADYRLPGDMLDGLGLGGGVRYVGSTYGDVPNTVKVPSNTLVDLALYYDWDDYRFSLNVQNALDDEHVSGCFVRSSVLCTYGQTRTVSGSIRYRW